MPSLFDLPFGPSVRFWSLICLVLAAISVAAVNWAEANLMTDDIITGAIPEKPAAPKVKRIIRSVLSDKPLVLEQP